MLVSGLKISPTEMLKGAQSEEIRAMWGARGVHRITIRGD